MAEGLHAQRPVNNTVSVYLALFVTASIAAGCSGATVPTLSGSTGGSSDLGETLAGTWILTSIQPAGQAEQAKPDGATYSLTLTDGRLSSRVDCNSCSGTFALSGSTLTAGPALACTRAACPTWPSKTLPLLGGENAVTASGNTLVLSSTRGVMRFTR